MKKHEHFDYLGEGYRVSWPRPEKKRKRKKRGRRVVTKNVYRRKKGDDRPWSEIVQKDQKR